MKYTFVRPHWYFPSFYKSVWMNRNMRRKIKQSCVKKVLAPLAKRSACRKSMNWPAVINWNLPILHCFLFLEHSTLFSLNFAKKRKRYFASIWIWILSEFSGIFRFSDTCEILCIYFNLKLTFTIPRKIQWNSIERIKLVNTAPERACILHVYSIVASVFRRQQFLDNFLRYYTSGVFAFACNQIAF